MTRSIGDSSLDYMTRDPPEEVFRWKKVTSNQPRITLQHQPQPTLAAVYESELAHISPSGARMQSEVFETRLQLAAYLGEESASNPPKKHKNPSLSELYQAK